jgi:hypothetical protein
MKKVVKGKIYNTKTAEKIANYWNGLSNSDFRYFRESLYITKKGDYFIAGRGGPMTIYGHSVGNLTASGEDIFPMSREDAERWTELFAEAGIAEKLFGHRNKYNFHGDLIREA